MMMRTRRDDREQIVSPPHGDLGEKVGMSRVGEQAFDKKPSSELVDLLEREFVRLFRAEPFVFAVLERPLLLVSDGLDDQEKNERDGK